MRVALVVQKLVGLRGGAERVVVDLARGLSERGHDVVLVTFEPRAGSAGYDVGDVPVVDLFPRPLRLGLGVLGRGGRGLEAAEGTVSTRANSGPLARAKWEATHGLFARRLARWARRNPQDVLVGFLPPAISAVAVGGSRLPTPRPRLIASTHNLPSVDFGDSPRWDQNPVARRTNLWALGAVDAVTVLQPEFVDELPPEAREHAVVMPNAVVRLGPETDPGRVNRIIGVGRLTDVKRFDLLVEAFAQVAGELPGWDVSIHGEGPERSRLDQLARDLGVDDRVHLAGATADMAAVYDRARILCHPARFEGFGLAVAEAILHGVDVVASRSCPGVDRLVEPGATGLLVDEDDDPVGAFAAGLRAVIADPPAAAERRASAARLGSRLDPEAILDRWVRLLAGE